MKVRSNQIVLFMLFQGISWGTAMAQTSLRPEMHGEWRSWTMHTYNQGALPDFHGNATGLRAHLTGSSPHWEYGLSLYSTFQLPGSFVGPDPVYGALSRYEMALFNIEAPEEMANVLLGQAYISYRSEHHQLRLGRYELITPMFNTQDGRMIPTLGQGVDYHFQHDSFELNAGIVQAVAPRGGGQFHLLERSLGVYSVGKNVEGGQSAYNDNIRSVGLLYIGSEMGSEHFKLKLWNYFAENIFNTAYLEVRSDLGTERHEVGIQYVRQDPLGEQGENPSTDYMVNPSNTMGAFYSCALTRGWQIKVAYNRINDEGRFLFPRTWGREPLFTFQPRERLEGRGDVQSILLQTEYKYETVRGHEFLWRAGVARVLGSQEAKFNKYGMPNYHQVDVLFRWSRALSSDREIHLHVLYVAKPGIDFNGPAQETINRSDLQHIEMALQYEF